MTISMPAGPSFVPFILGIFAIVFLLSTPAAESLAATNGLPFLEESIDTAIMSPYGGAVPGRATLICGTAFSYSGVVGVTVRIQRSTDGASWDGLKWRSKPTWLNAVITSGKNHARASWQFPWKLPRGNRDVTYLIQAAGRDASNAIEPTPSVVEVTVDNQRPMIRAIRPLGANPGFTNSKRQLFLVNVLGATELRYSFSLEGLAESGYRPYKPRVYVDLPGQSGESTIYWQFRDGAANESLPDGRGSKSRIMIDLKAPGGGATINNDYPNTSDPFVYVINKSRESRVTLDRMRFSNDRKRWSSWEPFSSVKSGWDISAREFGGSAKRGKKRVYVQYLDKAGNSSTVLSDSIDLIPQPLIQPHGIAVPEAPSSPMNEDAEPVKAPPGKKAPDVQALSGEGRAEGFSDETTFCLICHDLHSSPTTSYSAGGLPFQNTAKYTLLAEAREKAVCYTCHNGTASESNTQAAFGDDGTETSTRVSVHPVNDATLLCSDCHTPHMEPENEDADNRAEEVYRLLRVRYPTYFGYVLSSLNTLWEDTSGDTDYPGAKRLDNASKFCGGCHGAGSELPGGDVVNNFVGTEHETDMTGPESGTAIKCNRCHEWHGSDLAPMLQQTIDANVVTGNDDSQCYACHQPGNGGYPGQTIFQKTRHYTVTTSSAALVTWPGTSNDAGWCHNCHDQHGTPYQQDRLADKNEFCYTCHDDPSKSIPSNYSYRGENTYEASAHFSTSSPDGLYPVSGGAGEEQTSGECTNCHAVMGRDNGSGGTIDALLIKKQETTCFGGSGTSGRCHAMSYDYTATIDAFYSTGTRTSDVYDEFNPTMRWVAVSAQSGSNATMDGVHDISDVDQTTTNPGAKLECYDCHNTHMANQSYDFLSQSRLVSPDSTNSPWLAKYNIGNLFSNGQPYYDTAADKDPTFGKSVPDMIGFCLQCHDGAAPSAVSFGVNPTLNILTYYAPATGADQHGRADGNGSTRGTLKGSYVDAGTPYASLQCTDCHEKHGSGSLWSLRKSIFINGKQMSTDAGKYYQDVTDDWYGGGLQGFCTFCHKLSHPDAAVCGSCHNHTERF